MSDCKSCELLRKMGEDLLRERNEARAIAHERGLDAGELEAENRRLREGLTTTDMYKLLKEQVAQNRRLREALQRYLIGHGSDLNADCPCRVCEQARHAMKPLPTFDDVRGVLADSAGEEGK